MGQMNRRELLTAAATAACACMVLDPMSLLAADATSKPAPIDVGLKSSFSKDGITDKWLKTDKFAVVRTGGKIIALTTVCTHKGCPVGSATDHFLCPCHKGQYNLDGSVKMGPPKVALAHYEISVGADNHVMVDKSKTFTDDKWSDPASFITVDAA